jgi:hypothetical protein
VIMKISVFWVITLRSPLKASERFRGTCRLYLKDRNIIQATKQREAVTSVDFQTGR